MACRILSLCLSQSCGIAHSFVYSGGVLGQSVPYCLIYTWLDGTGFHFILVCDTIRHWVHLDWGAHGISILGVHSMQELHGGGGTFLSPPTHTPPTFFGTTRLEYSLPYLIKNTPDLYLWGVGDV